MRSQRPVTAGVNCSDPEWVPCDSLAPYPGNARRGNVEAIADSLLAHGQYRPIVVRRAGAVVLAGNHTLAAAKRLGWATIQVVWVDVDDDQARRIVVADNRLSELGHDDQAVLADLLAGLPDLVGTGFTAADVGRLAAQVDAPPGLNVADRPWSAKFGALEVDLDEADKAALTALLPSGPPRAALSELRRRLEL